MTVVDRDTDEALILTAAHCVGSLAPCFREGVVVYTGDPMIPIGHEQVGRTIRSVPLAEADECRVDAAVIRPRASVTHDLRTDQGALRRQVRPLGDDAFALHVSKVGGASGLTSGEVLSVEESVLLRIRDAPERSIRYESVFGVVGVDGPFAARGDSGSVVFDDGNAIVGLVVGLDHSEEGDVTYCVRIEEVLVALGVAL